MTLPNGGNREQELRLWPGVVLAILQLLLRFGWPMISPDATIYALISGVAGALAILIWWMFFSRVPHVERWGALAVIAVAVVATKPILDKSIENAGMGMLFWVFAIPAMPLALVVWAVIGRFLSDGLRRPALVASILLFSFGWALVRTEGVTGEGNSQFAWRFTKTPEQRLLAQAVSEPAGVPAAPVKEEIPAPPPTATPAVRTVPASMSSLAPATPETRVRKGVEWPGFRGAHRDDVVTGLRIKTEWTTSPPVEMWRRPVGPGWSSFAVGDGLIYTQEQRGDFEVVACYNEASGKPVWVHRDAARFWESNGGAGPRGTPTLQDGRIYTFGATGIVNALDAATGHVIWTHNAASDIGVKTPEWGFTSSPLVVDDEVIVAVSGRLAAYDLATGSPRWTGPKIRGSYSSPHLATIGGVTQVLLMTGDGATSVAPADGSVLWRYPWEGAPIIQPAVTPDGAVLISSADMGGGMGTRRLAVTKGPSGWTATEVWTSAGLKPYFNDIVVHNGHAYGFDGGILSCIDLQDGKRKWKGGRYGHGQLLLLADQDVMIVLSEEGELALVSATPGQFTEIAKIQILEGKTWNHFVVAGDTLLLRNDREMVALRLASAGL